tara:strand:- start:910 stop:1224 length:315 start_codon:yes stop_codon:yes gene_type:complete
MDSTLKNNDVAVVLRPIIEDNVEWDGSFQLMVTVAGPVELDEEHMRSLLTVASYLCAAVPLMEESKSFTELLRDRAEQLSGNVLIGDRMVPLLTRNTKCDGGVQ